VESIENSNTPLSEIFEIHLKMDSVEINKKALEEGNNRKS
jgi:hypothetical protein